MAMLPTQPKSKRRQRPKGVLTYIPWSSYDALIARLRQLASSRRLTQQRDALAMLLGLHGLRVGEVRRLTVDDLDLADGRIGVATLKGGRRRGIKLGPGMADAIVAWRAQALESEARRKRQRKFPPLKPGDEKIKNPLLFAAGVRPVPEKHLQRFALKVTAEAIGKRFRFHACRHTYGMRCYAQTRELMRVKKRMGHASIGSTMDYVGAWEDLDDDEIESIGQPHATPSLLDPDPRPVRGRVPSGGAESCAKGTKIVPFMCEKGTNAAPGRPTEGELSGDARSGFEQQMDRLIDTVEYLAQTVEQRRLADDDPFQLRLWVG